jgi:hypothetical protein
VVIIKWKVQHASSSTSRDYIWYISDKHLTIPVWRVASLVGRGGVWWGFEGSSFITISLCVAVRRGKVGAQR